MAVTDKQRALLVAKRWAQQADMLSRQAIELRDEMNAEKQPQFAGEVNAIVVLSSSIYVEWSEYAEALWAVMAQEE